MQTQKVHNRDIPVSILQEYKSIQTLITQSHFNFEHFCRLLEIHGQIIYGLHFKLYKEDQNVLLQLYGYFTGDSEVCSQFGLSLTKGLFLTGKTGVGKTVLMKLVRNLMHIRERYKTKPCQQIAIEYMADGSEILMKYGRNYVDYVDKNIIDQSYCFDDLGAENMVKHYGTDTNVLGQIILMRYELFQGRGVLTHFTSNLTAPQIEKFYGERVRSRLREMCNWIEFSTQSQDKRK